MYNKTGINESSMCDATSRLQSRVLQRMKDAVCFSRNVVVIGPCEHDFPGSAVALDVQINDDDDGDNDDDD